MEINTHSEYEHRKSGRMKARKWFRNVDFSGANKVTVLVVWLSSAVLLFLAGLIFLVCGALYGVGGLWFFATGALCLFAAMPILVTFIWYVLCRTSARRDRTHPKNGLIATVGAPEFYTDVKSDYNMGPLLIMTLPKRKNPYEVTNSHSAPNSVSSTPDMLAQRHPVQTNKKNVPPLASAETLTPSLRSSFVSIDSNV